MILEPFPIPEENIIDLETGLSLNVPASRQLYPGWWNDHPEMYDRLRRLREVAGIQVDDFPDGTDRIERPRRYVPMGEED